MMNPYDPSATTPPLSGMNAPGNTLTAAGPTQEPYGAGDAMMQKKRQMAMMLMGQQMQQASQTSPLQAPMRPRQQLDIYGQPV